MAGWTGLEPAASAVTGRRYNQLNYHPASGAAFSLFSLKRQRDLRLYGSRHRVSTEFCMALKLLKIVSQLDGASRN